MLKTYDLQTKYNDIIDITPQVIQAVEESGAQEGTVIVYNPHSTAGITVFSPWDPAGFIDLDEEIRRLIPTRIDFHHQHDTPQDAAGHLKSALFGVSVSFIVHDGKLMIGGSQKIYFLEFDGPRTRKFNVKVQKDQ